MLKPSCCRGLNISVSPFVLAFQAFKLFCTVKTLFGPKEDHAVVDSESSQSESRNDKGVKSHQLSFLPSQMLWFILPKNSDLSICSISYYFAGSLSQSVPDWAEQKSSVDSDRLFGHNTFSSTLKWQRLKFENLVFIEPSL